MLNEFNLLYVEDEKIISMMVMSTAEEIFDEVFYEENGQKGLESFKENQDKIDLIITDINMPIMDGLKMSKEIKAIDPTIPIIITSAHNDNDFLHQAIDIGIDAYIMKPIDLLEIAEASKKILTPKILKRQLEKQEEENQDRLLKSAKFTAIGQLAAGLTHEINTPLTYIKGSVEIMNKILTRLENSKNKELLAKQFDRIDDGVDRLINIVESMKEVAVKSSEEFSSFNVFETIVVSCVMAYNRAKHVVNIKINDEPFSMNMEKSKYIFNANIQKQRVEQVWIIIINNALDELVKIDGFEQRKLDISIIDDEDKICVEFEDNAGGIKEEIIDSLFEPFKSTKESSGMGIGLSLARKIINEQKGEISVSNKNNGATFKITLLK